MLRELKVSATSKFLPRTTLRELSQPFRVDDFEHRSNREAPPSQRLFWQSLVRVSSKRASGGELCLDSDYTFTQFHEHVNLMPPSAGLDGLLGFGLQAVLA